MTYFTVSAAYTAMNILLSFIIFIKSYRNTISKFYFFCVQLLIVFGIGAYILTRSYDSAYGPYVEQLVLFVFALYPFFFIHFITYFIKRKEILRSFKTVVAIYFVGLFSYAMILLEYIPKPFDDSGEINQTGYIFYITWSSIFFSIGIAMLIEVSHQFRKKARKAKTMFVYSAILLFFLPGPFMESVLFGVFRFSVESYFYFCTLGLIIAIYSIFRHKIVAETMYDAVKSALKVMNDIMIKTDENFHIEMVWGETIKTQLGYSDDELIGQPLADFIDDKSYLEEYRNFLAKGKMRECYFDVNALCKDGRKIAMNFSFTPVLEENELSGFLTVGRDMTERKKLEDQLRQSQKMESLGTLASGIAHDFNNLLQIVLLNTSGLKKRSLDDEKLSRVIDINTETVDRGTNLVRQILTFARKVDCEFTSLNVNTLIEALLKLLKETFPRAITLAFMPDKEVPSINADQNQLHQVLMNLCVNARDAIQGSGTISIKTEMVTGLDVRRNFSEAKENEYICITVADTGSGMADDVRSRVFEPFFTTKGREKGSGLGLAVAYGIIGNHKGFIDVKSIPGKGTTFFIYLPVVGNNRQKLMSKPNVPKLIFRKTGTILLVEDEAVIRDSVLSLLSENGFAVLTANDGYEAVKLFRKHNKNIDLVIMDIELPRMNGWDALKEIKALRNGVPVVVLSGYPAVDAGGNLPVSDINEFIAKPAEPSKILRLIGKNLESISGTEILK